ncbi:YdeI/OmpD-associated family protein [Tahibacter soli]|uniref:YdeI/OmpD-associated family protein n=1 Tax=Tahibacter soli TaxID=2983605 RepID=A0A9X3YK21_9GAMM|nr:YdeI/OmpD-associated family protein [Tahibacter soli]MDC8013022.1 YdeI/OmpD-associated family protein [Tahibacter soli]
MGTRNPKVDAYIAKSAEFARPILEHLREIVHAACPEVEEEIKWSSPHFMYRGMLCGMAAFKQHCAFGFWKAALVVPDDRNDEAMGNFGCIATVKDLPPRRTIEGYIKKAMKLNEDDVKPVRPKSGAPKPPVELPDDLAVALKKNKKAGATYEAFSPSARREYVEWITEAKREETRAKRVAQAVEWMAEGKQRNWKYQNC